MSKKASLLWIDLEMTGLDPREDRILEVGAIATDWKLNEVARFEDVVKVNSRLMKKRMVGEFWDENSGTRDALMAQNISGKSAKLVEAELLKFIRQNFNTRQPIYLAGNSIHQDQKFIEREWPKLNEKLHYQMLDVSVFKIVFENMFGKKFTKPAGHRAMDDVEGSIAEFKIHLRKLKK